MVKWIIAAALLMAASPASAEFWDGNKLLTYCDGMGALGYVYGAVGAAEAGEKLAMRGATPPTGALVCIPEGVNGGQAVDVACAFLKAHPQSRHLPAAWLVMRSLRLAWPCP